MTKLLYRAESYKIIGACMEVHSILGRGLNEIVYGDALEVEFGLRGIDYNREVRFPIHYKDNLLAHHYYADFVVYDKIILEIKAVQELHMSHFKQTLNYIAASKLHLGLLVNFGSNSLEYRRVIL